ncbi:MAG: VCBS domain-containing protein, partial [Bradyrhizobium sp.]|uniref:VCBS domain-containing protein n=1 Tax=Bradyrhizobium sp. TaxID=376 RepID=UPI002730213E
DLDFAAASTAFDYLADGEVLTLTYTVEIDDHDGGTTPQTFVVTITGTNDIPSIAGDVTGDVTEDLAVDGADHINTTGLLTIADADAGQSNFTAQTGTAGSNGYGSFTLAANGTWTYTADNTQTAIQELGLNDFITDSFIAFSSDGTASQLVTVTIHGTNDIPAIAGVVTGDVTEDVAVDGADHINTTGLLTIADADAGQFNFTAQTGTAGSNGYGSFTLAANGTWNYAADNTQTAIQQLDDNDFITDSFFAVSSDGSANQLVIVTIHGTTDYLLGM